LLILPKKSASALFLVYFSAVNYKTNTLKTIYTIFALLLFTLTTFAQEAHLVKGNIIDLRGKPLENVHVINLNKVIGTITNTKGDFKIKAAVNDTLHFSIIGFKSIKVKVTHDWIKFGSNTIEMTESAYALEEVLIYPHKLTGFLEIDTKYIPTNNAKQYSISGLPKAYESGKKGPSGINKVLGAIFNPADLLYKTFSKKGKQMRKLRQMKKDDNIRKILSQKFDRELLCSFLKIAPEELEEVLGQCNYSEQFIKTANDLQILDAISGCYEEYKVLKK